MASTPAGRFARRVKRTLTTAELEKPYLSPPRRPTRAGYEADRVGWGREDVRTAPLSTHCEVIQQSAVHSSPRNCE